MPGLSVVSEQEESYLDSYARDGVTVVRSVFTREEMDGLRSAAYMALTQLQAINDAGYKHNPLHTAKRQTADSPGVIYWPCLANSELEKFRTDVRLQRIVSSILGPNVKELNNQVYYRLSGDGESFAWHQDIMFRSPRSDYPGIVEQNAYLQTGIIVDRMSAENGGVEYVLGSHKLGDIGVLEDTNFSGLFGFDRNKNSEKFKHLPTKIFDAAPGDVLLWSSLIVHGSQPNSSPHHRMYYMNGFAKAECCKPWPHYLKNGRLVNLDQSMIP